MLVAVLTGTNNAVPNVTIHANRAAEIHPCKFTIRIIIRLTTVAFIPDIPSRRGGQLVSIMICAPEYRGCFQFQKMRRIEWLVIIYDRWQQPARMVLSF